MMLLEIDLLPQWLDDFLHPKSDFTHGHFIMDVVIISFFVLIYYIFPWIRLFSKIILSTKNEKKLL